MIEPLSISDAAKIVGLTPHVLRAWERRYGVLPSHYTGKARRYSSADIEHLKTLKALTEQGIPIRIASQMSKDEVKRNLPSPEITLSSQTSQLLFEFIKSYQLKKLALKLQQLQNTHSAEDFLLNIVVPFLGMMGQMVESKNMSVDQEHAFSAMIRDCIIKLPMPSALCSLPTLAFCTPEGDHHELGILIASRLAQLQRFPILFLGANLPAYALADILIACRPDVAIVGTSSIKTNIKTIHSYLQKAVKSYVSKNRDKKHDLQFWIAGAMANEMRHQHLAINTMAEFHTHISSVKYSRK